MMLIADSLLKEKALEPAYKALSLVKGGKRQHRNYVKQLSNFAAI
jgi:hypothetical protein